LAKQPDFIWERTPPIRVRKNIPTSWVEITINEGRNRQVRRMMAHINLPVLRLVRLSIGKHRLTNLKSAESRKIHA
ncbi:Ribosomal large subunit pseudouridine synthase E, partial [hydrothermal vent metagenome]